MGNNENRSEDFGGGLLFRSRTMAGERLLAALRTAVGDGVTVGAAVLGDKLQQIVRNLCRIVASDSGMLFEVVAEDGDYAQGLDGMEVGDDLASSFEGILGLELIGHWRAIDQGVIEELLLGMAIECPKVIGGAEPEAFIRLCHELADIDFGRRRIHDGLNDASDQEVRNEAGE